MLKTLATPTTQTNLTMLEITSLRSEHFDAKTLVILERFTFWKTELDQNESVAEFVMKVRRMSEKCKFGSLLNEAL